MQAHFGMMAHRDRYDRCQCRWRVVLISLAVALVVLVLW